MSDLELSLAGYRTDGLPETIADRTRRVYDRLAGIYPVSTMFFHSRAHRALLADSGIEDGMKVIEVATGSGEMFRRLVKTNRNGMTVGLDLSPNMAARTFNRVRRKFPGLSVSCQAVDARRMPFPDQTFDVLMACYLLELMSIEDVSSTLSEFFRVLRPGGTLSLILIGQDSEFFNRIYKIMGSLMPAFCGPQIDTRVPGIVERRGFQIRSNRVVRQTFYPSRILVAKK